MYRVISKQLNKLWLAVENILHVPANVGSKHGSIPNRAFHGFADSEPFSFTFNLWALEANTTILFTGESGAYWSVSIDASFNLVWLISNGTNSVSCSVPMPVNKGRLCALSYNNVTKKATIYAGTAKGTDSGVFSGSCQNANPLKLGKEKAFYVSMLRPHAKTFEKADVDNLRVEIGLLPSAYHAFCMGEYPCNHRYGKTLIDVVENYNPAKTALGLPTLTANHGQLVNNTDAETGVTDKSSAPVWVDHYLKKTNRNLGVVFSKAQSAKITCPSLDALITGSYWVLMDVYLPEIVSNTRLFHSSQNTGLTPFSYIMVESGANPGVVHVNGVGGYGTGQVLKKGAYKTLWSYDAPTGRIHIAVYMGATWYALSFVNAAKTNIDHPFDQPTFFNPFAGNGFHANAQMFRVAIGNSFIDNATGKNLLLGKTALPSVLLEYSTESDITGNTITDVSGNGRHGTLVGVPSTSYPFELGEAKTGLPEISKALKIDGTHTIAFPLSNTVQVTEKGYLVQAYRVKTGQSLTERDLLYLKNNGLYANPTNQIKTKLDAYYVFNSIDTASGNRILDLIGANHATLSGYNANEVSPTHIDYAIKSINSLRGIV